jgi:hypothetical protein
MKTKYIRLSIATALLLGFYSCKKGEVSSSELEKYATADSAAAITSDSVSSVATMKVKDKQFIKTADVNMEVKMCMMQQFPLKNRFRNWEDL